MLIERKIDEMAACVIVLFLVLVIAIVVWSKASHEYTRIRKDSAFMGLVLWANIDYPIERKSGILVLLGAVSLGLWYLFAYKWLFALTLLVGAIASLKASFDLGSSLGTLAVRWKKYRKRDQAAAAPAILYSSFAILGGIALIGVGVLLFSG